MHSVSESRVRPAGNRIRGQRGMTLIEVMVAAFILLAALVGIVPLFLTGLSQASAVRYKSLASNIAREKLEEIRQLDYREIYTEANRAEDATLGTRTLESLFGTHTTEREMDFDIFYRVTTASYEDGDLKQVSVDVTWAGEQVSWDYATDPPTLSRAAVTTLVHQQYLGPRGARLSVSQTWADPLGTPFPLIAKVDSSSSTTVRYYIAQADWNLVYNSLDTAAPVKRNVYMRLAFFDDDGQSIAIGDEANKYMIDNSCLHYSLAADGSVQDVYFEKVFDAHILPDGYWEMRAVVFNVYDEPGNIWRLRVRVETGPPQAPPSLVASAGSDNQTVILNWTSGNERDRSRYVIQRSVGDGAVWQPWVTVCSDLGPKIATYTDVGSVANMLDPWGSDGAPHYYRYAVYALDRSVPPNTGASTVATVILPPATTTTTLSSTPTSSTSTTSTTLVNSYQAFIKNISNTNYSVVVKNVAGVSVFSGQVNKNTTATLSHLPSGNYLITATANNKPTLTQSFSLPAQAGYIVLTIM